MRCLLFIILAGSAVKCDENNYFVVEMTEDQTFETKKPFYVYWNVPTMQCRSKKIPFEDLFEKFGILQNENDSFLGKAVSILYDPGLFPALLTNETSGQIIFRNGGVPQEGDLAKHLEVFRRNLVQCVPDEDFSGVGIIDFESWRPIFRQNFGALVPYKDVSYEIEKKLHWWWPKQWVQTEAIQRFEESARTFMQRTLLVAKEMRPNAQWGYYGFPYCFNMASNNMKENCAEKVPEENDRLHWLWSESTALYPSIYSSRDLTSSQLSRMIRGRVKEAQRLNRNDAPVLPYFWFRYRDGGYMTAEDLNSALQAIYASNASGFIVWGSSNDVNTVKKCHNLREYLEGTLGPAIAKYTGSQIRNVPTEDVDTTTTASSTVLANYDPDYHWDPPDNYEQNIQKYVNDEMKNKTGYDKTNASFPLHSYNDNALINMILNNFITNDSDVNNDSSISNVTSAGHASTQTADTDMTTVRLDTTQTNEYYASFNDNTTEILDNTESTTVEGTNLQDVTTNDVFKFFNEDTFNEFSSNNTLDTDTETSDVTEDNYPKELDVSRKDTDSDPTTAPPNSQVSGTASVIGLGRLLYMSVFLFV
ncbi:hyaluronidase-like isoform X1 [Bombyx mandarina]|uniref:Hyaluronidase n=1 Tax=Bombyx mandarina TaxID=7092 RepID=A0A6J2K2X7_BOMMA|nr:hyaluronidase-like isoform X1 [Bombyx mandarina]